MMNSGGMMKSSFILFLAAMIIAMLPIQAFSQYTSYDQYLEFNTLGGGARAAGMGGAFLGISEGEYAYAWNPAGMVFAEKRSIGLQFNSASDKFQFGHISSSGFINVYDISQAEGKRSHFNLDYSGFAVPFSLYERRWAVGGGFRNIQDMDFKYTTPGLFNSLDQFSQKEGVDAVSVSVGGKITENIGLGITGNDYIRGGETNYYAGNSSIFIDRANPIPDTVDLWTNYDYSYSGVNFDLGLMAQFSMVKGSFVVHTPYDLKQDVKETINLMILPYPSGNIFRFTTKTNIPLSYSAGLSIKPFESLLIAADFDSRPMSKSDIKFDYEMLTIPDTTYNLGWQDLNQFRVGLEYSLNAGFADIPLRVGFRNNPSVAKKLTAINEVLADSAGNLVYVRGVFGDQVTTNIITFGSGLHFQRAWIDLAYQFGSSSNALEFNPLYAPQQKFHEKNDYSRLFISAGMNF
jgi:long-subunit fatty acid transport protein